MTARYAIRGHSWAIAGGFLLAFCWLGWAAVRFGSIFQGMGMEHSLPVVNWFAATYGPIAFPLFGILAAAAFVLSDLMFRKRWIERALIAVFALLLIFALRGFLICGVFMAPNVRTNPAAPGNGAITVLFQAERLGRAVPEPRWLDSTVL